jgi:hypothetical protein
MWLSGLVSRVVLGTASVASLTYTAGLAAALWAGFSGNWWIAALAAAGGGSGYVAGGMRWMRQYRRDPQVHARAESLWWIVAATALAAAGLVLLLVAGR